MLLISLSLNFAMVDASLKSWSSKRAVVTRSEKPKTSLYHAIKLGHNAGVSGHRKRGSMLTRLNLSS